MKFRYFLQKYEIQNMNIHKKYYTKAAEFYRENLSRTILGEDLQPPPDIEEGRICREPKLRVMKYPMGFGSDDLEGPPQPKKEEDFAQKWEKKKKQMEEWGENFSKGFKSLFKKKRRKKKEKEEEKVEIRETADEREKEAPIPEKLQLEQEPKPEEKELQLQPKPKSSFSKNFDEKMSIFKSDMKNFGQKLSQGWDKFSKKTKKLAVKSKKYFEREFSSNPAPQENRPVVAEDHFTTRGEVQARMNGPLLVENNLVERSEREMRVEQKKSSNEGKARKEEIGEEEKGGNDLDEEEKRKGEEDGKTGKTGRKRVGKKIKIFEDDKEEEVKYI